MSCLGGLSHDVRMWQGVSMSMGWGLAWTADLITAGQRGGQVGNVVDVGRMGKMEMAWLQGAGLPWEKQKTHPAPTDDNCHFHSLHCCHVSLQHPEVPLV